MTDDEIKLAAIAEIAKHLAEVGSKEWAPTRKKYPAISDRAWWRLVASVKEGKTPQEILAASVKRAKYHARKNLPAVPSPEYIAKGGVQATANIDFMDAFAQLMGDATLLAEFSTKRNEDGSRNVKNPMFFAQSIKLRVELIGTQIRAMREVWDLQRMQNFFDAVVEEVAIESPACSRRIMERLDRLNAEFGMTINARPVSS